MKRIVEYLCVLFFIALLVVGQVGAGGPLRQNTAINIMLGPFLDVNDGYAIKSDLSIVSTDVRLQRENASTFGNKNSGGCTHVEQGWYLCVLNDIDTNTLGKLKLSANISGALPVWDEFVVLHANVYDVLFGAVAPSTLTAAGVWGATVEGTFTYEEFQRNMAAVLFGDMIYTSGTGVVIYKNVSTEDTNMVTGTMTGDDRDITDKYGD